MVYLKRCFLLDTYKKTKKKIIVKGYNMKAKNFSTLVSVITILGMTFFSVNAYAKASTSAAVVKTTTTTTTTTEATTETTTSAPLDENGVPLTGDKLSIYNIVNNTPKNNMAVVYTPDWKETVDENNDYILSQREVTFENGDYFYMHKYQFKKNNPENLKKSLTIPGKDIEIRYVNPEDNQWYMSKNIENTAYTVMYVDTDCYSIAIGVPAVYLSNTSNNSLERVLEQEKPVTITQVTGGYVLNYEFPQNTQVIGEIWVLRSKNKLANWNNKGDFDALKHDLGHERRFAWDGYYFPTPSTYVPYNENMLYRHPSNYVGSAYVKNANIPLAKELGYILTKICMENQNTQGYWATGPKSGWLVADFGIGGGFYDTRFNTDFAENLLNAYKEYNNDDFLRSVVTYANYYIKHAQNNNYVTQNGGILVEDYGYSEQHIKTHVSLNHQLAEMNFLYELYEVTREQSYLDLADKMLLAVEDTRDQWVLPSGNLNYALYYTGVTNTMVDYPYLTYNDLYITKNVLKKYHNRTSATIEYLMANKLEWMKANNVTGYYGQTQDTDYDTTEIAG